MKYLAKEYITPFIEKVLKGEDSLEYNFEKLTSTYLNVIKDYIKSQELKMKRPKRTINNNTIPAFLDLEKTIDTDDKYTKEQQELIKVIIRIVK